MMQKRVVDAEAGAGDDDDDGGDGGSNSSDNYSGRAASGLLKGANALGDVKGSRYTLGVVSAFQGGAVEQE
jgi:hypothetical protein